MGDPDERKGLGISTERDKFCGGSCICHSRLQLAERHEDFEFQASHRQKQIGKFKTPWEHFFLVNE